MMFSKTLKRELEVAFSKDAQPLWFRVLKYVLLFMLTYFLWGTDLLWIIVCTILVVGTSLHFWFRHKTNGWTKSYGMWKHESERAKAAKN